MIGAGFESSPMIIYYWKYYNKHYKYFNCHVTWYHWTAMLQYGQLTIIMLSCNFANLEFKCCSATYPTPEASSKTSIPVKSGRRPITSQTSFSLMKLASSILSIPSMNRTCWLLLSAWVAQSSQKSCLCCSLLVLIVSFISYLDHHCNTWA